jgi:hypothetical protein
MDRQKVLNAAVAEVALEDFREQVKCMKDKIRRKRSFWDRVFPYKITITKKEKYHDRCKQSSKRS